MTEPLRPVGPPAVTARVAAIVLAIAAQPRLTVTEVAHLVRLPVSTTSRLLAALTASRLVERTAHGHHQLTLKDSRPTPGMGPLRVLITAAVADLSEVTRLRARFGVWHRDGVSYLTGSGGDRFSRQEEPSHDRRLPSHVTALGKALRAFAPDREVRRVLAGRLPGYTRRTLTTADTLSKALEVTRAREIAVAVREFRVDEWAMAAPVFGPGGVIAALELLGTGSFSDARSLVPALQYAARALGRRLCEYPEMLPAGTGPTPLQWPIDPTVPVQDDPGKHSPERDARPDRERFLVAVPDVNLAPIRNGTCRA